MPETAIRRRSDGGMDWNLAGLSRQLLNWRSPFLKLVKNDPSKTIETEVAVIQVERASTVHST